MLSVKIFAQFLRIPKILRRLPASPYVTITRSLYKIMELPVASFRVYDPLNFASVRVVDHCRLQFRWLLAGGRRCKAVEQRDVENIVLPERIQKVYYVSIPIDDLTYHAWSCPLVMELL